MNRGTVMEIEKDTAVVLTPDGQFLRVKASGVSVGEEITWTEEARNFARAASSSAWKRRWAFSGASAAVLLLMFFALWSMRPPAVVAYVSMDINPSLEMGLDAQERVLELRAVNADAETIVQGISYRGKPVEEVMREVAQKLATANLLGSGNEEIVIASVRVRSVDDQWESKVTEKIKQVLQKTSAEAAAAETAEVQIETVSLPVEVRKEAIENGISSGKMAIWLAAEKSGRSVPLDQIQEQSVESISSSIGGLKQVLEESGINKDDKNAWKQMLAEQKEKRKQEKEGQTKENGERKNRKSLDSRDQKQGRKAGGSHEDDDGNKDDRDDGDNHDDKDDKKVKEEEDEVRENRVNKGSLKGSAGNKKEQKDKDEQDDKVRGSKRGKDKEKDNDDEKDDDEKYDKAKERKNGKQPRNKRQEAERSIREG